MKSTFKTAIVGAATMAVVGGSLLVGIGAAAAAAPPWVGTDPNAVGGLAFYNGAGVQIQGGALTDSPLAAYVVGTTTLRAGDTKATLFGKTPDPTKAAGAFPGEQISASTTYPPAGAPTPVSGFTLPDASGAAGDNSVGGYAQDFPQGSSAAGYANTYELRVYTSANGKSATVTYDYADITVNTGAGTWAVSYTPTPPAQTSTAVTASENPAYQGDNVTFTATESPAVAGSVQFQSDGTNLGSAVAVNGSGVATTSTSTLTVSATGHAITAVFTPTSSSNIGSNGSLTEVVNPPAIGTATTVATDGNAVVAGHDTTLTSTVTPASGTAAAPGTVAFYDNSSATALVGTAGTPTVVGDVTTYTLDVTTGFASGPHSVVAKFTPTSATTFKASASSPSTFVSQAPAVGACAQPGSNCTDTQYIQATIPVGTLVISTPYTQAAPLDLGTLSLNAAGTELTTAANTTPNFKNIVVTDGRSGNLPWTVQALASPLTDGGSNPGSTINAENVGLTTITATPGNGFTGTVTPTDNPAANGVAPSDPGTLGLGGGVGHTIAKADHGLGTVTMQGYLALNAPTSTEAGVFTGTITFTVA